MRLQFYARTGLSNVPPFDFSRHKGLILADPVTRTADNAVRYPVRMTAAQLAAIFWRLSDVEFSKAGWDSDALDPQHNIYANPPFIAALPYVETYNTAFDGMQLYMPHALTEGIYNLSEYRPSARDADGWYPWLGELPVLSARYLYFVEDDLEITWTYFTPTNKRWVDEFKPYVTNYTVAAGLSIQVNGAPCGSPTPLYAWVYGGEYKKMSGTVTINFITT